MIFITVGTHEQPFDRLIKKVDELKGSGKISDDIIIQTGFSTYLPKYCEYHKLISFSDMDKYINEARIVITHGGPASFIAPLRIGKIPVVVPRQKEFGEHVNNHQLDFAKEIEKRLGNILVVESDEQLEEVLINYDNIVSSMAKSIKSNTDDFNISFEKIVNEMFGE